MKLLAVSTHRCNEVGYKVNTLPRFKDRLLYWQENTDILKLDWAKFLRDDK